MLFSSLTFLTLFLPVTVALVIALRGTARNTVLLVASLLFYTWGSGLAVLVLVGSGLVAWAAGWTIVRARRRGERTAPIVVGATVLLLAPLVWFKYAAWFSEIAADLVGAVGIELGELSGRELPIGISFFTFQALSYVFDVDRGDVEPQRSPRNFLLYLALFPQLIAGPIVRYRTVAGQIERRTMDADRLNRGLQRFVFGLAKKVIVADSVGQVADAAFATSDPSTLVAWVGAIAYAIQIFFDFSGYSDMAIGLGTLLGFDFPENFRRPYSALSVTDFWRRWHITLSTWFRDYVYIPLGGNRVGSTRQYVNLVSVFALTALWHGAAWTFIVWGGLHAVALVVERLTGRNHVDSAPRPWFARARTALLVVVFWVFFRATSIGGAGTMVRSMFTWQGVAVPPEFVATLTARSMPMLVLGSLAFVLPREPIGLLTAGQSPRLAVAVARPLVTVAALAVAVGFISTGSLSPFLYFQF